MDLKHSIIGRDLEELKELPVDEFPYNLVVDLEKQIVLR
jgi:hypothetical protein